jgi:Xaa-Pro aminopeptidase
VTARIDRLRASLVEPLLVSDPTNVYYLTGFRSSNAALLVEPDRLRLFTDFRYLDAAREVDGVEVVQTKRKLPLALSDLLEGRIGFEAEATTYASWETLGANGLDLVPRRGLVEALRVVKDESELAALRRACAITSEGYARLAEEPFVGRTEREIAARLIDLFAELGGEGLSFEPIVAAGPNGANPHADTGSRLVEPGDTIVVDAGAIFDGYCADCTRTFAAGDLDDELRRAYDVCLEAQLAGLAAVRAGVSGVAADAAARDTIEAAGFGARFGHGLGHGVGLLVHEAPALSTESTDTLAAGNAVTVEPGIYLTGRGGIRIEDLVIVGDDGCEVLTRFTKELVTVR